MARTKRRPRPVFTGQLNKPIDLGSGPGPGMAVSDLFSPDIAKRQARERSQKLMAARLEKLELLARHYLIDDLEGIARYLVLSLCLATDFVPGFWDVYSHETPRGRGRPKALAPHVLLNLVEGLKGLLNDKGMATKDAEACAIIAKLLDPRLSRPSQKTALARRARTLANRLGPARRIHEK